MVSVSFIESVSRPPIRLASQFLLGFLCVWWAGWYFYFGDDSVYRQFFYALFFIPASGCLIAARADLGHFLRQPAFLLSTALGLWALVSLAYQIEPIEVSDAPDALRYTALILVFLASWYIIRREIPSAPLILLVTLVAAGLVSAVFLGLSWLFDLGPVAGQRRLDPKLAFGWNTNRVASLFVIPLLGGLVLALRGSIPWLRVLGVMAALAGAVTIFWTQSRQGMIGGAVVTLGILAWCRHWRLFMVACIVIGVVGAAAVTGVVGARNLTDPTTLGYRWQIYQDAIRRIAERPLLGEGWMTSPRTVDGRWGHAHNTFLHVWMQGGLVSLTIFVALLAMVFHQLRDLLRSVRKNSDAVIPLFALAVLCNFVAVSLITVRDPFMKPTTSWLLFWLPVAFVIAEWQVSQVLPKRASGLPGAG